MQLISSIANLFTPSSEHVSYPFAKVLVNGIDVTNNILPMLIDLTIEDKAGFESDTISMTLANPKGNIFVPKKGAKIVMMIGYKKSALLNIGTYELSTVSLSGGATGHTMQLTGKAAFFSSKKLKSTRSQSFDEKTIKDIVNQIAGDNGMSAAVDNELGSKKIKHIDQVNESDMHFLTRLADDYDAIFKVAAENIIFASRGNGLSISGSAMQSLQLNITPKISYSLTSDDRSSYDKVNVYYHDKKKGSRVKVEEGDGDKTYEHKTVMSTKEEAKAKAKALLGQFARANFNLNLTMAGNPSISAETPIIIVEPSVPLMSGRWIVEQVSHNLSPTGFTTNISCYPDTKEAKAKLKEA